MTVNKSITTKSAEETVEFGRQLALQLSSQQPVGEQATVICLYGELGSGKTTFAQGFAKGLGITRRLLSPTFIIVRRYDLIKKTGYLYHLDLYRIQTMEDLEELGLSEILADSSSFVLIEWAEKVGVLLPKHRLDIQFSVEGDGHKLVLSGK